jgi:VWFA-related protein
MGSVGAVLALSAILVLAQAPAASSSQAPASQQPSSQQAPAQKPDEVPDAPSTVRPPQNFPDVPPSSETPPQPSEQQTSPSEEPNAPSPEEAPQPPPSGEKPPINIRTVPPGGATQEGADDQQQLYRIVTNVNQVLVPVRVTDDSGRLINGLLSKDFSVYEDGVKQKMNFFTSDPFALSAAVVIDLGMPDVGLQKVNETFSALEGAFSAFDEVAIYTYSSSVSKQMDFKGVGRTLTATLNQLKLVRGRNNGPPVTSGPLGPSGPMINNQPVMPGAPIVVTPPRESHVLNDAVLAAAIDLSKQDKARRKIIFVISDGRESRSAASYSDVLKVLLTNGIMVYGLGVESAAIPVYGRLQRLHLPKLGTGNILPKYASATGGQVFAEYSPANIETAYGNAMGDARNLYTLGYMARTIPSSRYREIEVVVGRPSCNSDLRPCVDVTAKAGYYPLPPGR